MWRAIALTVLVSCLVGGLRAAKAETSAPAASPLPRESRERFEAALAALAAQDWRPAATEFADSRWASTPLAEYASFYLARSLRGAGDDGAAQAAALRAAEAGAESRLAPSAFLETVDLLASVGSDAAAATYYRRFLASHPDHPGALRARLALAGALLAGGRTAEAARTFRDLWIHSPASPEAQTADEQLKILGERGLAGPAPSRRERVERAEHWLAAGRPGFAEIEAEALLAEDLPADLQARALKVVLDAARRARRYDTAAAVVARALASLPLDRQAPWLLDLARLKQRRSPDEAVAAIDRLVRAHPKSPEAPSALLLKGRILEDTSRVAAAQAAFSEVATRYPDDEDAGAALWRLGWLAWFKAAYAEAASWWGRILAVRGGRGHREAANYWLGRAEQVRGEPELANRRFHDVQRDAPRSYYGILAASRSGPAPVPRGSTNWPALPANPLDQLQADPDYARVEALRDVGLAAFADEELVDMTRRSVGDLRRLYALSAAYAQESRHHLALRVLRRYFQPVARSGLSTLPRAFWEMLYPIGWRAELTGAAEQAAVDPFLIAAVVREESSYHAQARSRVGARGLMQLMPDTARPMARARRLPFNDGALLDDPTANLGLGTAYFGGLLREFRDARLATAAYNAGPGRVREWWGARRSDDLEVWVEQIPFDETRGFVKRVMLSWAEYRRVYGAPAPAELDPPAAQEASEQR